MAWISITESDVETRLTGAELTAAKTAALAPGQTNPLTEIVGQVVDEIRGYIAACRSNTLGAGETVPDKLLGTALAMIRYRLASRLPVRSLLTDARVEENREALVLLRRVADCRFAVEEPDDADDEAHGSASPAISAPTRNFSDADQDGI